MAQSGISATELEILSFFACEPERRDADVIWFYNDNAYRVVRGRATLSFALQPSCADVRLRLLFDDVVVYEMNALAVDDVRYHRDGDRETLEIRIGARDTLWVTIDPAICLRHEAH
jgi:hypothetical protein